MKIFEDELNLLGVNLGTPEMMQAGSPLVPNKDTVQLIITVRNNEDFPEFQIRSLAKNILDRRGTSFRFKELVLPKAGIKIACTCRRGMILFRYIEYYEVGSDDTIKQIDVLI